MENLGTFKVIKKTVPVKVPVFNCYSRKSARSLKTNEFDWEKRKINTKPILERKKYRISTSNATVSGLLGNLKSSRSICPFDSTDVLMPGALTG